ncbi:hypothetical protein EV359DRAFT_66358 [Lentinula novae-zelandiae]|nr:hypothetical protein EV359DRAFT_66358 [Lentinula novae-zelandiae]
MVYHGNSGCIVEAGSRRGSLWRTREVLLKQWGGGSSDRGGSSGSVRGMVGWSGHDSTLEAQLPELQWENWSLTSALRDTSHSLEAHQHEVEQLRTSQQGLESSRVVDQFQTLDRALSEHPKQTLLEKLREIQGELITA